MCALFGSGVNLHTFPLESEPPTLHAGALELDCAVHAAELLRPAVHHWSAEEPPVALKTVDRQIAVKTADGVSLALSVILHPQAIARFGTRAQHLEGLSLDTAIHQAPEDPAPTVHRATAFMRERPLYKRLVPTRFLTPAQSEHWINRLSASKRISVAMIELIGVVPDIPLVGDAPVHYLREEAAIAYKLPDRPVSTSTIVLAKHRKTGELLLGRFAKD